MGLPSRLYSNPMERSEHSTLEQILATLDNLTKKMDEQDTLIQELLTKVKDTLPERAKILVKPFYNEEMRHRLTKSILTKEPQRKFTELGMSLTEAFDQLQQMGYLQPLEPISKPVNKPPSWSPNHFCGFHQTHGHSID